MSNIVKYITFETIDSRYRIVANIPDSKTSKYISFEKLEDGKYVCISDAEEWLIKELYPALKGEVGFKDFISIVPLSDFADVLGLFEEAIKDGVFASVSNDLTLQQENAIWGIIQYLSKEQHKNPKKVWTRIDVFKLINDELD